MIDRLSKDMSKAFPDMKGFSITNLRYMKIFAQNYTESKIRQQLANELPWFHLIVLLRRIKNKEERNFYFKKSIENGWSRNVLSMQIESDLYSREGKAITNFKQRLAPPNSDLAQKTLKDPYIFDFLTLSEEVKEKEIKKALI